MVLIKRQSNLSSPQIKDVASEDADILNFINSKSQQGVPNGLVPDLSSDEKTLEFINSRQRPQADPIIEKPTRLQTALPPLHGLQTLGRLYQRGEAVVAEPMLTYLENKFPVFGDDPKSDPGIGSAFMRGMLGRSASRRREGRQAEVGDVVSEAGKRIFGVNVPDPVADAVGLALSMGGLAGGSKLGSKAVQKAEQYALQRAPIKGQKLIGEAEKLTTEILQPSKEALRGSLKKGRKYPGIEQGAKSIRESKTFSELKSNLENTKNEIFNQRNQILTENNRPVSPEYIFRARKELQKKLQDGEIGEKQFRFANEALKEEAGFFQSNKKYDLLKFEKRKEQLQKKSSGLIKKRKNNTQTLRESGLEIGYDELQKSVRQEIEQIDPAIKEINSRYEGLRQAIDLAAGQEALVMKEAAPRGIGGALEEMAAKIPVLRRMFRLPDDFGQLVTRSAASREAGLAKTTRKIEKLTKKGQTLIEKGSTLKFETMPEKVREAVKMLTSQQERKLLPGITTPKQLGVTAQSGEGFVRMSRPDAEKILKEWASENQTVLGKKLEIPTTLGKRVIQLDRDEVGNIILNPVRTSKELAQRGENFRGRAFSR